MFLTNHSSAFLLHDVRVVCCQKRRSLKLPNISASQIQKQRVLEISQFETSFRFIARPHGNTSLVKIATQYIIENRCLFEA